MQKNIIIIALCALFSLSANAQYQKFHIDDHSVQYQKKNKKSKKPDAPEKVDKAKEPGAAPQKKIEDRYAAGSCPLVDGKVEWTTTIKCPGLSAKQIYDRALDFLNPYCKDSDKDEHSQIALINPTTHEIGARIGEYVVFQNTALSLDRAMMHYTLCLYCSNDDCKVVMRSISYKYADNFVPGEDMLSDENALNKTHTDFCKGGFKKFRTKTIDAKDALFQKLSDAINKK